MSWETLIYSMHDNGSPHYKTIGGNIVGQNLCNLIVIKKKFNTGNSSLETVLLLETWPIRLLRNARCRQAKPMPCFPTMLPKSMDSCRALF